MRTRSNNSPPRYRKARSDCTVETLRDEISSRYGIPLDCLHITNPNGRRARCDKRLGSLRADYERQDAP